MPSVKCSRPDVFSLKSFLALYDLSTGGKKKGKTLTFCPMQLATVNSALTFSSVYFGLPRQGIPQATSDLLS